MTDFKLPPLPEHFITDPRYGCSHEAAFTASQMTEYARLAVLQERERCAKVCEDLPCPPYCNTTDQISAWNAGTLDCADAIRKGE